MALVQPFPPHKVTSEEWGAEKEAGKKKESHFYYTSVGTF